jgi:leucyl-tRNA synthetase
MAKDYNPKEIEAKWQKKWLEEKVFAANDSSPKPKYYQLETFPYPSGAGLHVGHPKGYIAEDIHARYMRMGGDASQPGGLGTQREVLYTMGWDAFGLPTENYAMKVGKSPKEVTLENTNNFRRQVRMFGLSYDWDREINTSSPEYYTWTQWLFIQLYKKGLAYRKASKVNWCPKDQTVLANEQVIGGRCERCGTEIEERDMTQWFLKITDYADRLLSDLQGLDWPAATVKRQEDWVGKSEGAEINFSLKNSEEKITIFTTRPDTLFGATYLVLAPEHPWVTHALDDQHRLLLNKDEIKDYAAAASHKTELMRKTEEKEKTGVELKGVLAINPANNQEIPIWVADYVLGSYGTGAIMAVPAHDERDFAFAKKFNLPSQVVVSEEGKLVDSDKFNGLDSETAKGKITEFVGGQKKTQYRLRDWSVSRQRYWGVPIPMIYCETCAARGMKDGIVPVPENELPVLLPDLQNFRPQGTAPLASSPEFMNVTCPQCGGAAKRDAETLDTFVDSSWYYLRYPDPHNAAAIFDKEKTNHWMPVDLYIIGAEHTVLHLLYSRFITKFLQDEGLLKFNEPFLKLRHQGLIRGTDGAKMSKSKGNVVNPDEIVGEFGADTVRLYEMFMGPFEDGAPWDPKGILGVERFLKRFWKYIGTQIDMMTQDIDSEKTAGFNTDPTKVKPSMLLLLHKTIKKVGEDIESLKFNTAISSLMILLNGLSERNNEEGMILTKLSKAHIESLIKLLHPFAPHMAQELWSQMGNSTYLDFEPWPKYDPALIKEEKITLVFQVNSKTKDTVEVDADITEDAAKALALANEKIRKAMAGDTSAAAAQPKKIVYVDKKLVNIVISLWNRK